MGHTANTSPSGLATQSAELKANLKSSMCECIQISDTQAKPRTECVVANAHPLWAGPRTHFIYIGYPRRSLLVTTSRIPKINPMILSRGGYLLHRPPGRSRLRSLLIASPASAASQPVPPPHTFLPVYRLGTATKHLNSGTIGFLTGM